MLIPKVLLTKVGIYALISVGVLWAGRQWLNHHDNKVAQETRNEVTEEQRIKAEAKFKAEREAAAAEKQALIGTITQLNKDKEKLYGSLNSAIKLSKQMQDANAAAVINVPDSQLNGAIRTVLRGQQPVTP